MRKLGLALGIIVMLVAACSSPAPTTAAPPIVFEPGAASVPCETGPMCFPVADFQHDVVTHLTAAGYSCVTQGEGSGALCGPTDDQFRMQMDPTSVGIVLPVGQTTDPATGVALITTGLRAILPLLFPKFPGAQQFFLQQLHTDATQPGACLTRNTVGHNYGYDVSCLGRPAPVGAHVATAVTLFIITAIHRR